MSYITTCSKILDLFRAVGKEMPHEDSDLGRAVQILQTICDSQSHTIPEVNPEGLSDVEVDELQADASDIFEALEEIESNIGEADFTLDFDGNEYRIINESSIWEIYRDEIENIVTDCYDLKLNEVPSWIAVSVDWEQTAKNAYVDGYGHTFSSYDGSEEEAAGYYIFRTN